VIKKM